MSGCSCGLVFRLAAGPEYVLGVLPGSDSMCSHVRDRERETECENEPGPHRGSSPSLD